MLVFVVVLLFRFVVNQWFVLDLLDDCLESVQRIRSVLYNPSATVGIEQSVSSLHDITVAFFPVGLVVSGMGVLNSVVELVLGVGEVIVWDVNVMLFLVVFNFVMLHFVVFRFVVLLQFHMVLLLVGNVHSIRRNGHRHTSDNTDELVKEEIEQ